MVSSGAEAKGKSLPATSGVGKLCGVSGKLHKSDTAGLRTRWSLDDGGGEGEGARTFSEAFAIVPRGIFDKFRCSGVNIGFVAAGFHKREFS